MGPSRVDDRPGSVDRGLPRRDLRHWRAAAPRVKLVLPFRPWDREVALPCRHAAERARGMT